MARKTLIRNDRPHEVRIDNDPQLAQSQKSELAEPLEMKGPAPTARQRAKPTAAESSAKNNTPRKQGATAARKATPPKLPARIPADRLWEDGSAVMQRLGALQEQNARLAEQLQRLQSPVRLKGLQP